MRTSGRYLFILLHAVRLVSPCAFLGGGCAAPRISAKRLPPDVEERLRRRVAGEGNETRAAGAAPAPGPTAISPASFGPACAGTGISGAEVGSRRLVLWASVVVFLAAAGLAAAGAAGAAGWIGKAWEPAAIGLLWAAAAGYRFARRDPAQAVVSLLLMGALWTVAIRV